MIQVVDKKAPQGAAVKLPTLFLSILPSVRECKENCFPYTPNVGTGQQRSKNLTENVQVSVHPIGIQNINEQFPPRTMT